MLVENVVEFTHAKFANMCTHIETTYELKTCELREDIASMRTVPATALFVLFVIFFAIGAMGGGDVKLIAALGLWFPVNAMVNLLIIMSILGGILTLAMLAHHRLTKKNGQPEIPYGIAIAAAALWTIFQTIS